MSGPADKRQSVRSAAEKSGRTARLCAARLAPTGFLCVLDDGHPGTCMSLGEVLSALPEEGVE